MKQTTLQGKSEVHVTSNENDDYKRCSECGQNEIPFKMGVCICGNQVGKIQYIKNTKLFAKNYYPHQEQFDIAVEETFAGIPEWKN